MIPYRIDQETCDRVLAKCSKNYTAKVLPNGDVEFLPNDAGTKDFIEDFLTELMHYENSKRNLLHSGPIIFIGKTSGQ